MLEGVANGCVGEADGDGAEGASIELRVSLHDIEGALRRKGVVMMVNAGDDFALFGLGICNEGERQVVGWSFDRGDNGFGSGCARGGSGDGVFNKGDLQVGNLEVVDGSIGFELGGRHVVVV